MGSTSRIVLEGELRTEWEKLNRPFSLEHRSLFYFVLAWANFDSNNKDINKVKIVYTEPEQYFSKYFDRVFVEDR
jgi:putative SOS response-associated peptidase YedK